MSTDRTWQPDAILRFIAVLFLLIGATSMIGTFVGGDGEQEPPFGAFVIANTVFQVGTMFAIHMLLREHKRGWAESFGLNLPSAGLTTLAGAVVGLVVVPLTLILGIISVVVLTTAGFDPQPQEVVEKFTQSETGWTKLYFVVMAVAVAPIMEECLFRGVIYKAAGQAWGQQRAMWGAAILFSLTHANMMSFVPLVFLAVVLTKLYDGTRNLLAPIAAHAAFNGVNLLWLWVGQQAAEKLQ